MSLRDLRSLVAHQGIHWCCASGQRDVSARWLPVAHVFLTSPSRPVSQRLGEGLLDDVAEFAQALDVRGPLREITGRMRRLRSSRRLGLLSYPLSPSSASGRRRGRPDLPARGGMPSTRARVCVTSLTLAAVVMDLERGAAGRRRPGGAYFGCTTQLPISRVALSTSTSSCTASTASTTPPATTPGPGRLLCRQPDPTRRGGDARHRRARPDPRLRPRRPSRPSLILNSSQDMGERGPQRGCQRPDHAVHPW